MASAVQREDGAPRHTPVMLREVIDLLDPQPGKVIVDATLGLGGHAAAIAPRLQPGGLLVGLDRDAESLAVARRALAPWQEGCRLFHLNFVRIAEALSAAGVRKVDGVLFDLGASLFQLTSAERGFSFAQDGPLDMRMDRSTGETAAGLVARLSVQELETLIRTYGEERFARRIARRIDEARRRAPLRTSGALAAVVASAVPRRGAHAPQMRTYQALRIAVNHELDDLRIALDNVHQCLRPQARLVVIAFHSLEDRIVKTVLRQQAAAGEYRLLTRKPLRAAREEVMQNRPSRSARLRAAERAAAQTPP